MSLLPIEAIRDGIASEPSIFPQNIDLARQAVLFLLLDEAALRSASFLDDRILSPQLQGRWVRFAEIGPWLPLIGPRHRLNFIFHAGHVGSTLISRLLDDIEGVLGLREPLPLRVLATAFDEMDALHALAGPAEWKMLLDLHLACWGRGYAKTQSVVVKATSSASPICQPIFDRLPEARALLLNLEPEPYLASLLAGENSYLDLRAQAQGRMRRLTRMAPSQVRPLHDLSLGEIAAMTWTVETLSHRTVEQRFGERLLRVDFDAFLEAPGDTLRKICAHFRLKAPDAYFSDVEANPTLARYSKAQEHAYTPTLRRQILAASRTTNLVEISKGLAWIDAFAQQFPALGTMLLA